MNGNFLDKVSSRILLSSISNYSYMISREVKIVESSFWLQNIRSSKQYINQWLVVVLNQLKNFQIFDL